MGNSSTPFVSGTSLEYLPRNLSLAYFRGNYLNTYLLYLRERNARVPERSRFKEQKNSDILEGNFVSL